MIGDLPDRPSQLELMRAAIQLHKEWPARMATRSSLIKLAHSAVRLYASSLAKDCVPRDEHGHAMPLVLAITCLQTIRQRYGDVK
jgi:hypothetical protein